MHIYSLLAIFGALLTTPFAAPTEQQPTSPHSAGDPPLTSSLLNDTTITFINGNQTVDGNITTLLPNGTETSLSINSGEHYYPPRCTTWNHLRPQAQTDCAEAINKVYSFQRKELVRAGGCWRVPGSHGCTAYICAGCKDLIFSSNEFHSQMVMIYRACVKPQDSGGFIWVNGKADFVAGIEWEGGKIPTVPLCRGKGNV
ncbi:hypothetical protein P154DRAFT_575170 [Amniculicola lignicola CBS 123094]|uniref:Ecp2 effector protein domain-containing protein n=1 Tax=Amniculicola lignicola CBS 123094 TaxID=1392246 RepID=A0A6A5WHT1_9PLEO|nr:hypothetical protein P154DRAFT_575170 [Amniculicola lignicola CBS 123094]